MNVQFGLVAAFLVLTNVGCKKTPERIVPQYPGSSPVTKLVVAVDGGGTIHYSKRATPDSLGSVQIFFDKQLVGPGWEKVAASSPVWKSANMSDRNSAVDDTRRAGKVSVENGKDETFIEIWEYVPPKEP